MAGKARAKDATKSAGVPMFNLAVLSGYGKQDLLHLPPMDKHEAMAKAEALCKEGFWQGLDFTPPGSIRLVRLTEIAA